MEQAIPIVNSTPELADCRDKWTFDGQYRVWCLEDVLYTQKATTPKFQRLSIFVPEPYLNPDGTVDPRGRVGCYTALTAPVVFENNSAGYMQMPHTWLGGPRDEAEKYLARGMVYVSCGCRGWDSRDAEGKLCGKSPWTLIDLKTAIRFLRHNRASLPGDFQHMISVGWSAGGAMSSLIGVTGDHPDYEPYLRANGAFMDEKDDVFAAQIYCPIIDLDHADLAYEWQFSADEENTVSHAGPAGRMDPFRRALSYKLKEAYIAYFNGLGLKDPECGLPLTLGPDGRSGSGYAYLKQKLEEAAAEYMTRLADGSLAEGWSVEDYLAGGYTYTEAAPPVFGRREAASENAAERPTLGDMVSRPPRGASSPARREEPGATVEKRGADKRAWLRWDGKTAHISSLDDYVLAHCRRMKPCTSFDTLGADSGENREFGTPEQVCMHFSEYLAPAIDSLRDAFPAEYARYHDACKAAIGDEALAQRRRLLNPLNYVGADALCDPAAHYRIRVGAQDADTAFIISMELALLLSGAGKDVDYRLVWDRPHCEADYPGEVCDWIDSIVPQADR